ncbi:MAG: hypothetical protein VX278_23790 [Myxococcota bacterium]|nr:hypothetical protein [Myxococcota bacterium]
MILVDPHNPRATLLCEKLRPFLEDIPLTTIIGGDGWMLHCIRTNHHERPFLGLNAGTLGFLMNDIQDLDSLISELKNRAWDIFHFPQIHTSGMRTDNTTFEASALNDVYLARREGSAANLRIEIDEICIVEKLICDGVVVSTSLGSTAYSSSAGGSPSHPLLRAFHITPICAHTPRLRSFVVPQTARIQITTLHPERRPTQAVSDGVSHGEAKRLSISCDTQEVQIAFLKSHNFTEKMVRKVLLS